MPQGNGECGKVAAVWHEISAPRCTGLQWLHGQSYLVCPLKIHKRPQAVKGAREWAAAAAAEGRGEDWEQKQCERARRKNNEKLINGCK